jgi:hypothetical protein
VGAVAKELKLTEGTMITGAHSIIYSRDADRDRAFLRDVLSLPSVDVGSGWLIFGLPPAEVAVHPGEANDVHEFYLMTNDLDALVADLRTKGIACSSPTTLSWGVLTEVTLPGGGKLGIYQPRHARPKSPRVRTSTPARLRPSRKSASGKRRARGGLKGRRTRR